eukprot:171736_1
MSITTNNIVDQYGTIYFGICLKYSNVTERINNLIILIYAMHLVEVFYNQNMNDYVEVLQIININGIIPISDVTFTTTKIIDQYIYQISIENMVYWIVRNVPYGNRYG